MNIEIVKDRNKCKELWEIYSDKKNLWDIWELIECFHNPDREEFYFVNIKDDKDNSKGLIPLCVDKKGVSFFFGGGFCENRKIWADEETFNNIIKTTKTHFRLHYINHKELERMSEMMKTKFFADDFRYFLDLKKIKHDFSNHIKTFKVKHRKNLIYDIKKAKEKGYEAIWSGFENFDNMVEFNKIRFREESDYNDLEFVNEMKEFFKVMMDKGILHTLTIKINNEIKGVEYCAFFNNIYYVINGGYDVTIKNLGKVIIKECIEKAISLKSDEIDFLAGEIGWKELWNFNKDQYYSLHVNNLEQN